MAKEKRYYWLKFKLDFFDDLRIRKLQSIPGGDTYVLTYIKILTYSISTSGIIIYRGVFETIEEEIALEIREDSKTVRFVLEYASKHGMLEGMDEEGKFFLPYVAENTGSESASAKRVRKYRDKKSNTKKLPSLHCNATVTGCNENVTLETEIEIEIETDTEIEKNPLFDKWLDEYSLDKKSPPAYKAKMRQKIREGNTDAIDAFREWEISYRKKIKKHEEDIKIKSFDYSTMVGAKINSLVIKEVINDPVSSYIDIKLENGELKAGIPKLEAYGWIHKGKEKKA